jgi:hypothetical protein
MNFFFRTSLLCCLSVAPASAQFWFLENRGYYDAPLAEPRAAQTQVMFPADMSSFPFAVYPGRSVGWEISLGHEIPVLGYDTNPPGNTGSGTSVGAWGIGLWFPVSFHMIEDLTKDPSAPILNVDYRFSGMVKAQYGLRDKGASHIGVRFQFGHESTHIGDEFTLGALRTDPTGFMRVNVSYQYNDMGGSYEPNFGPDGRYQFKFRGGDIWLWDPGEGWYSRNLLQPYGEFIAGSKRNHEPYLDAEFYLAPKGSGKLGFITSVDVRDRTIYQYNVVPNANYTNPEEPTQWSFNTMVGMRQTRSGTGLLAKVQPTYFLKYYHGVNPNGQFRSQKNFQLYGFGVQFGF